MKDRDLRPKTSQELGNRGVLIVQTLVAFGTVSKAAAMVGLSERHTRRLLRELQARVGADNAYALVAWAAAAGVIEPVPGYIRDPEANTHASRAVRLTRDTASDPDTSEL
jgi:tRNA-dihydrouridine synthase